jgi:hypothetical protein
MGIVLRQHKISTAFAASPITLAFASTTLTNSLVCGFLVGGSGTTTISDPSNTYTIGTNFQDAVDAEFLTPFYKFGITGGQTTLTFTQGTNQVVAMMMEFTGVAHQNALRGSVVGQGASVAGTSGSAGTSIGSPGDLVVSGIYVNSNTGFAVSDGKLTLVDNFNTDPFSDSMADADWLSATGSVNPSYSWTGSKGWVVAAMAFRPECMLGSRTMMGVGCGIALAKAISDNPVLPRRSIILPPWRR